MSTAIPHQAQLPPDDPDRHRIIVEPATSYADELVAYAALAQPRRLADSDRDEFVATLVSGVTVASLATRFGIPLDEARRLVHEIYPTLGDRTLPQAPEPHAKRRPGPKPGAVLGRRKPRPRTRSSRIDQALLILGSRATANHQQRTYTLDDRPASRHQIIDEANSVLKQRGHQSL